MPDRSYFNTRRKNRRQKFIDLLGGKCERCGSTRNLHFDHKNPSKKEFKIPDKIDAPEDILLAEVKKCRLLCADCHRQKTREKGEHGQPAAKHGTLHMYRKYKCRCNKCRQAVSDYNRRKRMESLSSIVILTKIASGEEVYTFVPKKAIPYIKKVGLLPASKIIKDETALNLSHSDDKQQFIKNIKEKIQDPEWTDFVNGISAFFSLPDWSKIPANHFIFKNDLVPIKINLGEFIQDNPDTKLIGAELEEYKPDLYSQPEREKELSLSEIDTWNKKSPSELWKFYQGDTDKYAPDVPHLIIVTNNISPKYLNI